MSGNTSLRGDINLGTQYYRDTKVREHIVIGIHKSGNTSVQEYIDQGTHQYKDT